MWAIAEVIQIFWKVTNSWGAACKRTFINPSQINSIKVFRKNLLSMRRLKIKATGMCYSSLNQRARNKVQAGAPFHSLGRWDFRHTAVWYCYCGKKVSYFWEFLKSFSLWQLPIYWEYSHNPQKRYSCKEIGRNKYIWKYKEKNIWKN